ncbi:MAG: hypothetical protein ACK5LJ_09895 [Paracoccus sp. (in: a-proteobacteria)]
MRSNPIIIFLLSFVLHIDISQAQSIQPVYQGEKLAYSIINGRLKTSKKTLKQAKSSKQDIVYALNDYFGSDKYLCNNTIHVKRENIRFQTESLDTLETTVYSVSLKRPVTIKESTTYSTLYFSPSIVPQENYIIPQSDYSFIVVSFFFNMYSMDDTSSINKEKNTKDILYWIGHNYTYIPIEEIHTKEE